MHQPNHVLHQFHQHPELFGDFHRIIGHISVFSKDQRGSRLVETFIEEPLVYEDLHLIRTELCADALNIALDVYGGRVLQKFLSRSVFVSVTEIIEVLILISISYATLFLTLMF